MTQPSTSTRTPAPTAAPLGVALASYVNMFAVGTAYALSILQSDLPRLMNTSHNWSFAPFGAASAGLTVGVVTASTLIAESGGRSTAARGTALWGLAVLSTGHFLASLNFPAVLASLVFGGIGVGWTYLAIILMVSQAFPNSPLARSAIGPLGFSSGAAASFTISAYYQSSTRSSDEIGSFLKLAGVAFISVGVATIILLPSDASKSEPGPSTGHDQKVSRGSRRGMLWALLFFNALPGMVAFSALLPGASYYDPTAVNTSSPNGLPLIMLALAAGGLLASPLSSFLGIPRAFNVLFCARGLLLVAFSQWPNQGLAIGTLATILFGHGVGFSILPGLVKAELARPELFPLEYGQILTAWGASGVVASIGNAALSSLPGDLARPSLVLGLLIHLVAIVGNLASPFRD
ncbi:major facilitator transporter [Colletotrichum truncatum]|uniref:Major facilitator transporter n=1 Tax=Colletotrichum truncatum TaxID=5467 RepID=A0ACC3ZAG2_COLTU|nr:major facilitator transporter [Colletotrichum truncatum]KAF6796236.1 major facilitator transporter [Colletotrichum truncatum]